MTQSKKKTGKPFVIFLLCSIAAANAFISESPGKKGETFLDQERRQAHAKNILDRNIVRRITERDSVLDNLFDRRSFRTGPLDRKPGSDSARRETPMEIRSIISSESTEPFRDSRRDLDQARRSSGSRSRVDVLRSERTDGSRRASEPRTVTDLLRREQRDDRLEDGSRRLNDRSNIRFDRTLTAEPSESTTVIAGTLRSERAEQRIRSDETSRRFNIRNNIRFGRRYSSEPRSIKNILRQERSEQNDENSRQFVERKERSGENTRRRTLTRQASEPRLLSNILRRDRSERTERSVDNSRRLDTRNNIRFSRQASDPLTLSNFLRQDRSERRERSDDDSRRENIRSDTDSDTVRDRERSDEESRRLNIRNRNRSDRTLSRRVVESRRAANGLRFKRQERLERREHSDDLSRRRETRNLPQSRKDAEPRDAASTLRQERTERKKSSLERFDETSRRLNTRNDILLDRSTSNEATFDRTLPTRASDLRERSDDTSRRLGRTSLRSERRKRSIEISSRRNSDAERRREEVSRRFDNGNLRETGLSDATFRRERGELEVSRTSGRSERREEFERNFRTSELTRGRDTLTRERSEKEELSRDRFLEESLSSRTLPVFEAEKLSHTEVWANTIKIILAMYLIGQIFVDSKRSKFRFQNVVDTFHMKKVQ